jgi:hypothetical protein
MCPGMGLETYDPKRYAELCRRVRRIGDHCLVT